MNWWWVPVAMYVALVTVRRLYGGSKKYSAVQNAFLAKRLFSQIEEQEQERVVEKMLEIGRRGGLLDDDIGHFPEIVRHSFLALAMAELGHSTGLPGEEWHYVKNPVAALHNCEHQVDLAKRHFLQEHNIDIDFE